MLNINISQFQTTPACTLCPVYLGANDSGWLITGQVTTDYYEWVEQFFAYHEDFGFVCGNFEQEVFADSQEAFDHFIDWHPPESWDYADI